VDPADGLEQPQVRSAQSLLLGDLDQPGGAGVADLVHRVPETGDELPLGLGPGDGGEGERVEAGVVGRDLARLGQHLIQELAAVLGHPEEPRPAAEQAGRERALDRVGGGQVRDPSGDRGRGEAVVGQRDQDRLEDADLRLGRPALRHHPERQLAEPHLAHQVVGQVLAEQGDRVGVRRAERGRVLLRHRFIPPSATQKTPARRGSRRRARSAPAARAGSWRGSWRTRPGAASWAGCGRRSRP
jgi:hypothetical protein